MSTISVAWEQEEEAYIVREDGQFVRDYFDSRDALKEAVAIAEEQGETKIEVYIEGMFL